VPIKGLTDQVDTFRAFPQIATIRKGAPKGNNQPGQDLSYFRVEFAEQEEEAARRFLELYGAQPTDIDIILPFNEIERCWEAWNEAYVAGALVHRCDGEYVQYAINPNTGESLVRGGRDARTGEPAPCNGAAGCKPHGRLRVIVPGLQRLAYLLLVTGSKHDILSITQQLAAIRDLNGGQLAGIPLVLRRRPRKISTPGPDGKRRRYEKWLICIEADPKWVQAKIAALGVAAMPALDAGAELALPSGVVDADEEEGEEGEPSFVEAAPASPTGPASDDGHTVEGEVVQEGDCPHCGAPGVFHSGPFDECPARSSGEEPVELVCKDCGRPLQDYRANGKTYTVSQLVDIGQSTLDGSVRCGPCLKKRKEETLARQRRKGE
jgi:hypothetical protein